MKPGEKAEATKTPTDVLEEPHTYLHKKRGLESTEDSDLNEPFDAWAGKLKSIE